MKEEEDKVSAAVQPPNQKQPLLKSLEDRLHDRIIQKKIGEMNRSHNRAYADNLLTEIETLQWFLAQILTLLALSRAVSQPKYTGPIDYFFLSYMFNSYTIIMKCTFSNPGRMSYNEEQRKVLMPTKKEHHPEKYG